MADSGARDVVLDSLQFPWPFAHELKVVAAVVAASAAFTAGVRQKGKGSTCRHLDVFHGSELCHVTVPSSRSGCENEHLAFLPSLYSRQE